MASLVSRLGARALHSRGLVRAPIWLYRHGLGWLLGPRMLMLEHTGRNSGQARFVCLEVVEHRSSTSYVVVSGFGEHAQWYQNLKASPACRISSGRMPRCPARARFMNARDSASVLGRYQVAHPLAWKQLSGTIEQAGGRPAADLPMIELTLD
jgi:deazaflavin-dependent oxidoreductase (nitroreductase family)